MINEKSIRLGYKYLLILALVCFINMITKNLIKNIIHPKFEIIKNEILNENENEKININKYVKLCLDGKILVKPKKVDENLSKITIYMLVFNGAKYLKYSLASIMNQNMTDYEFIIVNDKSSDNTSAILQEYQNIDSRIKVINNKMNRGTLYSRTIALMNARGEYIMNLDCDDLYVRLDLFNIVYKTFKIGNYDIVEYLGIQGESFDVLQKNSLLINIWENGDVILQPNVSNYPFKDTYEYRLFYNANWLRGVKTEICKKAAKILGENMELRVSTTDDLIYTIIFHQISSTIKKVNIFGVFYLYGTISSLQKNKFSKERLDSGIFDNLFLTQLTFNATKNTTEGKQNALFIYRIFVNLIYRYIKLSNKNNQKYFETIRKQFLSCNYFTKKQKKNFILRHNI